MNAQRIALVRTRLRALGPTHLEVIDESHLHVGHAGAQQGACHLRVKIAAPQFAHLSRVKRHQQVYDALRDLMPFPIHALAIDASAIFSQSAKGTS